jgi:G3E family GTPase
VITNLDDLDTSLLIDTGKWTIEKLTDDEEDHEHDHKDHDEHHHHHEHEEVDEVVFKTDKTLDPTKLDEWLMTSFPNEVIRAKGFLRLKIKSGEGLFVFQMVGAAKSLQPFEPIRKDFDYKTSRMVLIGKNLNKQKIIDDLKEREM